MRPILMLAETGIIVRNLVLGSFADEALRHRPLVVAVRNPEDPRLLKLAAGKQIRFVEYFLEETEPPRGRLEKLTRWQTYVHRFKVAQRPSGGIVIEFDGSSPSKVGQIAMGFIDQIGKLLAKAGMAARFDDLFIRAIGRHDVTKRWSKLFREIDPAVVLSTTLTLTSKDLFSGDLPAVVAARELGIPVGTLVQSWDNLSCKTGVLPPDLDRYWTWNEYMTGELKQLHPRVAPDRVVIVGSPQFDFHRAAVAEERGSFMKSLGMDPALPYVLIGTGTTSRVPGEEHLAIAIARQLRIVAPDVQVLVRVHPKDPGARWEPIKDQIRELGIFMQQTAPPVHMDLGGFIPAQEFYRDQVSSLTHAAVVVNSSSTITVDAAVLDRPIICLAYDHGPPDAKYPQGRAQLFVKMTHYAPLVATGGVRIVKSTQECVDSIVRYLAHPELERAGRQRIVDIAAGKVDGLAGKRLANEVVALTANR